MGGRKIMDVIFDILAKMHGDWFGWDDSVAAVFKKIAEKIKG